MRHYIPSGDAFKEAHETDQAVSGFGRRRLLLLLLSTLARYEVGHTFAALLLLARFHQIPSKGNEKEASQEDD